MKTTIKKYLVVALMFGTLLGYANENNTLLTSVDGKRVKVEFNAVKKGNTLTIKQKDGVVLYATEIKNTGTFSKTFDFSALKPGSYVAELNKDFEIIKKSFVVKDGLIRFSKNDITEFKPVIRTKDELIYISKISFQNNPVQVNVYYKDEVIFSENITDSKVILNRVYKLSKEQKGKYKVTVNSNNKSYTQNFTI